MKGKELISSVTRAKMPDLEEVRNNCVSQFNYDETERVKNMKIKIRKPVVIAMVIALAMALSVTAYAIVTMLTPAEVARNIGFEKLADALENNGAGINQTVVSDNEEDEIGYAITLQGLVIGSGLNEFKDHISIDEESTYIVVAIAHEDGSPVIFGPQPDGSTKIFHFAVLFEGYRPWMLSSWHLGSGGRGFLKDGVSYNIWQVDENIEIFADRNVYLAVWDHELVMCPTYNASIALGPNSEVFKINDDGTIEFAGEFEKAHAMFVLPLDPSKADPDRVQQLLEEIGATEAAIN